MAKHLRWAAVLGLLISGTASAAPKNPWVAGQVGVGFPLAGGPAAPKVGVKAGIYGLDKFIPGVVVLVPLTVTFAGATTGIELTAGAEYRRQIRGKFYGYGDLTLGIAHARTVNAVKFRGYELVTSSGFLTRIAGGAGYQLNDRIAFYVEPFNWGINFASPISYEYSMFAGGSFSF